MKNINTAFYFILISSFFSCSRINIGAINSNTYKSFFGKTITTWSIGFEAVDAYLSFAHTAKQFKEIEGNRIVSFNDFFELKACKISNKLWLVHRKSKEEFLVANLDLKKGDRFQLVNGTVAIVESVFEKNGRKNIQLNYPFSFDGTNHKLLFIEGIGTNLGFLYNTPKMDRTEQILLCVEQDGEVFSLEHLGKQACEYFSTQVPPLPYSFEYHKSKEKIYCYFNNAVYGNLIIHDEQKKIKFEVKIDGLPSVSYTHLTLPTKA